jgi:short subunit dehydrogenase-like uncharacterized protein
VEFFLDNSFNYNSDFIGRDLSKIPVIIADSGNDKQLSEMAKQAKVIVNVVGPV